MRVPGVPDDVRAALAAGRRRLDGTYEEDEWGFDPDFASAVQPALDFLHDRWWRVTTIGAQNVPREGRVMIVANHAGIFPWEAAMVSTTMLRSDPPARRPRFLAQNWSFGLPWASIAVRKLGGVPASPFNGLRLLEDEHAVLAFPEGAKVARKPWGDRYRLERFGRGGFVEVALRARALIVPCAIVGNEELHPRLGEAPGLARVLRAPAVPLTPTFPLLGPLGLVPLPSHWRIEFCEPVDLRGHGPDAAGDRALVLEVSDAIRDKIQSKVFENVVLRPGIFR